MKKRNGLTENELVRCENILKVANGRLYEVHSDTGDSFKAVYHEKTRTFRAAHVRIPIEFVTDVVDLDHEAWRKYAVVQVHSFVYGESGRVHIKCIGSISDLTPTRVRVLNEHGNETEFYRETGKCVGFDWPYVDSRITMESAVTLRRKHSS